MNGFNKFSVVMISVSMFVTGAAVANGGFYSDKFRYYFSFGDMNFLVGGGLMVLSAYFFYIATN